MASGQTVGNEEIHGRSDVIIRNVALEDIARLLEVEAQAAPKTPLPEDFLRHCAQQTPDTFIVLEVQGELAGYILFNGDGHIHSTSVRPEFRRQGLGTRLIFAALERTGKRIWLEVRSRNLGAITFYKKLGMVIIGKIADYYGDDDALVMLWHYHR